VAREGALLASVRRLAEELSPEEILNLPSPPLPVRLWVDAPGNDLRVDLLIGLPGTTSRSQEPALGLLANRGVRIDTWAGRTATASAEVSEIGRLMDTDMDFLIEAATTLTPSLDVSVPEAWNAQPASAQGKWSGEGVVIGIVDSGIDITHDSFRTPSGSTRVLALRNQAVRGQTNEWDSATIDSYLSAGSVPMAMIDQTGHGTAVAGVAAGNGRAAPGGRYVGVAPSAELVVVAMQAHRRAFASTGNVIDAAEYIFQYARASGRRAVVNVSQGVQIGAHDPADQLEAGLSDLLGKDDRRILVVSTGNTGDAGAHARLDVPDGEQINLELDVPLGVGPIVLIDLWYDRADALELELLAPDGSQSALLDALDSRVDQIGGNLYEIHGIPNIQRVGANRLQVKLFRADRAGDVDNGRWTLRLHGASMTSGGAVHAWLDRGLFSSPRFDVAVIDSDCTITSPATSDGVLAVGSYLVSPTVGALATSSGRGPGRLGHAVNLLAAPGESITTCAAGPNASPAHDRLQGTSLAAAHVTGAIALMLQANPSLTRAQVLDCITLSARSDPDTATGPASGWGAGKLNIAAALTCATGSSVQ
jgi:subtilisin family serine protease